MCDNFIGYKAFIQIIQQQGLFLG